MSKKTLALIASLTVLTLVLVVLALNTSKQVGPKNNDQQAQNEEPTPTVPAHSMVMLDPNPVTFVSGIATVNVMIDTSDNQVTATQFDLNYDPKVLTFSSVQQGAFFQNGLVLINQVDKVKGKLTYAVGLTPAQAQTPKTGSGIVATIKFLRKSTASASADTSLSLANVLVSDKRFGQSVLKSATGTTVTFGAGTTTGTTTTTIAPTVAK